jgi:hypothetical protein
VPFRLRDHSLNAESRDRIARKEDPPQTIRSARIVSEGCARDRARRLYGGCAHYHLHCSWQPLTGRGDRAEMGDAGLLHKLIVSMGSIEIYNGIASILATCRRLWRASAT